MDIAFALLLAYNQWGNSGSLDYLGEAQAIINAIMQMGSKRAAFPRFKHVL
jgi:hypothetical protein